MRNPFKVNPDYWTHGEAVFMSALFVTAVLIVATLLNIGVTAVWDWLTY